MKNLILMLFLSFVVLSCSKDKSNNEPKPNFPENLIGKWKMTGRTIGVDKLQTSSTMNIYDIWFKKDATYESKIYLACSDNCQYTVVESQIYKEEYEEGGFIISFKPKTEYTTYYTEVPILKITKSELILNFVAGFDTVEEITYKKVE